MAILVGLGCAGCGHLGRDPFPLYPNQEIVRAPEELAILQGPISEVDQQPVSRHGSLFSLLPGCHVVQLKNAIGEGGNGGAWSAHLPPMVYAFRMMPAHHYVIDYRMEDTSGPVGRINITARDLAPGGSSTIVGLATSGADIDDCRAWTPAAGG
jgi:hypothetical protein